MSHMTYQSFEIGDLCRPSDYNGQPVQFVQMKHDGIRVVVFREPNGLDPVVLTREGKTDHWPNLKRIERLRKLIMALPPMTIFDCELHCPGRQATSVITMINEADDALQMHPFAVPIFAGQDIRSQRWSAVERIISDAGFPLTQTISLHSSPCPIGDAMRETLLEQARERGIEGWVLKREHYDGWFKLKPVKSVDCFVIDYKISDSLTFYGGLKAIVVAVWDGDKRMEIASVGSGFDAEFRNTCKPKELIGRVCEVSYDSLAGKGKLKFPRFMRWRDDKRAEECTADQLK